MLSCVLVLRGLNPVTFLSKFVGTFWAISVSVEVLGSQIFL